MAALRRLVARVWPVMRLRTIMFGLFLVVAALPGVAAIMLRVYENALVRGTEAELIAQGSALAASAALDWSKNLATVPAGESAEPRDADDHAVSTSIDLGYSPVLTERPDAQPTRARPEADAAKAAVLMAPVIAETRRATLASILLLDDQGIVLNGRDAGRSLASLPEVLAALAGRPATVLRHNGAYTHPFPLEWLSRGTDIRLHYARPIIAGGRTVGVVLVSRSPRALFRGMWEDRGKIALGTAAIFLTLVAMTALLSRAIVGPIEALNRATRALAEGRVAEPPRPTLRVAEIDGLIRDFATMAAAIEARSRYLRDFSAALAHEFKTPLTGVAGAIELLQDHGAAMSEDERARFLANMAGDTNRLNLLISRLMDLAKADMQRPVTDAGCDLAGLLARLADGLSGDGFAVTYALPEDLPPLAIEAPALETVLTTLIDNAHAAGASLVAIEAIGGSDKVYMTIGDNGSGIPEADRDRIFEPFFTSKRAIGGTGLGLPIARALVEGNLGCLTLLSAERGTCFHITLSVK